MSNTDSEVPQVPQDTISSLTFGSLSNTGFLTAGCWNKSVSLWTVSLPPGSTATSALSITAAASTSHEAPVLSTTFDANSGLIVSGGCDNQVRAWNFTANQSTVIGQHQSAVKDVRAVPSLNAIVSGSWDRTICYWDVRSQTKQPVAKIDLPGKVFSMDASGNIVAVGLEQKLFCVIDVRNPTAFAESTTSPHEFQTRVVAAMPNDAGYAIGSTEGRVHLQYFNDLAFHSFPFRCHRVTEGTRTIVHPVTSLSFHPGTGALATTGGPSISLWDHYGKVSISTFEPKNAGTISTGIFSGDGNYYGYACSYDWSMGANGPGRQKPHKIFIRRVTPQMVSVSARPVQK